MPKESTLTLTLKVQDDGTAVLDRFSKSVQKASDDVNKMSKAMQVVSVAAFINIAQQAINAATQIFEFGRAIASAGNEIQRMSRVFNMSIEDFQKWSYVATMADVDIEGFGNAFKFLTRSISEALQGSGDASKAFSILGINLKDATGKTKDQQTVMMETISAFDKFADGVNRDALMLAIFGRGWMSVKPLIDQGTKAIEENKKEAERMNLILGKDVIQSLSQSEDAFKRWSMTWKVAKMEIFEPIIAIFVDILELILKIKGALFIPPSFEKFKAEIMELQSALKQPGLLPTQKEMIEKRISALEPFVIEPAGWTKEWVAQYQPIAMKKPEAPTLPGAEKARKEWEMMGLTEAQYEEYRESAKLASEARINWVKAWSEPDIVMMIEAEVSAMQRLNEELGKKALEKNAEEMQSWGIPTAQEILDLIEKTIDAEERLGSAAINRQDLQESTWRMQEASIKKQFDLLQSLGEAMATNFNTLFVDSLKGGFKNIEDTFRKFCESMLNSFVSAIGKMITEWLFFENITKGGTTTKTFLSGGSGLGQVVGLIGGLFKFQEGGLITKPTIGLMGESGPEAVIPLKHGTIPIEKESSTVVNNSITIMTNDIQSFRAYLMANRDLLEGISIEAYGKARRYSKVILKG